MVLVDSPLWVSFLQSGDEPKLAQLLDLNEVGRHDMAFGEVAMGSYEQQKNTLVLLPLLPLTEVASHADVKKLADEH